MNPEPMLVEKNAQTKGTRLSNWLRGFVWRLYGYDLFISYAHDDWRHFGHAQLHIPRALRDQLSSTLRVFFDESDHRVGDPLNEATKRHVAASSQLVLIAGPHAMTSRWVLAEVHAALHAGKPIVVVDPMGDFARAVLDHPLRAAIGESIDIRRERRSDEELIAIAARKLLTGTQGRTVERRRYRALAIAAGILGVTAVIAISQSMRRAVAAVESADRTLWEQAQRAATTSDYPGAAMLLREMQTDEAVPGWRSLALTALLFSHPIWSRDASLVAVDARHGRVALWEQDAHLVVRRVGTDDAPLVLSPPSERGWLDLGLPRTFALTPSTEESLAGDFSGDGRYVLVRFRSGTSLLWDLESPGVPLLQWQHYKVSLSPDRAHLLAIRPATEATSGQVELRSLASPRNCTHCGSVSLSTRSPPWWSSSGVLVADADAGLWHFSAAGARRLLPDGQWKFDYEVTSDGTWFVTRRHRIGTSTAELTFHPVDAASGRAPLTVDAVFGPVMDDSLLAQGDRCAVVAGADGQLRVFRTDLGSLKALPEPRWEACGPLGPATSCIVSVPPGCKHIIAQWSNERGQGAATWLVNLGDGTKVAMPDTSTNRAGIKVLRKPGVVQDFSYSADGRVALLKGQSPTDLLWHLDTNLLEPIWDASNAIDSRPARGVAQRLSRDGRHVLGQRESSGDALLWSEDRLDEPRWLPKSQGRAIIELDNAWLTQESGEVAAWSIATGLTRTVGNGRPVHSASLSQNATQVGLVHHPYGMLSSSTRSLTLWDLKSSRSLGMTEISSGTSQVVRTANGDAVVESGLGQCSLHAFADPPAERSDATDCNTDAFGTRMVRWSKSVADPSGEQPSGLEIVNLQVVAELPLRIDIGPARWVSAAAMSRSGSYVAAVVRGMSAARLRIWRINGGRVEPVHESAFEDNVIGKSVNLAVANSGRLVAVLASSTPQQPAVLLHIRENGQVRREELRAMTSGKRFTTVNFDDSDRYLMAKSISPDLAVVGWDLRRPPWPVVELDRFPGQLHDAAFGPNRDTLTLVYGSGVLHTLPLAPQEVRQSLDSLPDPCLTLSRRLELTRLAPAEVEQANTNCRTNAVRPWTLARSWHKWSSPDR